MRIQIFHKIVTVTTDTFIIDEIQSDYLNCKINKKKKLCNIYKTKIIEHHYIYSPTIIYQN